MAVTLDATGTALVQGGASVTSMSYTGITVGSGNALIAMIGVGNNASSGVTAVWDSGGANQSMALLGTVNNGGSISVLFALRAPASGNKTLLFNWTTGAPGNVGCAISFNGVLQTSDAAAFPNYNSATGNGTALSVTVTSAAGDIVVGQAADTNSGNTITAGNTQIYNDNTSVSFTTLGEYASGAASVALTATGSAISNWWIHGVDVAAAPTSLPVMIVQPETSSGRRVTVNVY